MRDNRFYSRPMVIGAFLFNLGGFLYIAVKMEQKAFFLVVGFMILAMAKHCKWKKLLILSCVFFLGYINVFIYYEAFKPYDIYDHMVLTERTPIGWEGEIRGKKVNVFGNVPGEIGVKYEIMGDYNEKPQYQWGVVGEMEVYRYKRVGKTHLYYLNIVKKRLSSRLKESLTPKAYGYIQAMCLGEKAFMTKEEKERLKNLGLVHVIAISGLHMALFIGIISKLSNKKWLGIVVAGIYTLFIGAPPSAVRAVIMATVLCGGIIVLRTYDSKSSLGFASILLLMLYPEYICSASYHLSFLALGGIIMFSEEIKKKFHRLPRRIRGAFAILVSAQAFTLPYIMYVFQEINIGIFLGNIIVLPLAGILITYGFIVLTVIFIPFIGSIVGGIYNIFAWVFSEIAGFMDKCSLGVLKVEGGYAILYLLVFSIIMYLYYRQEHGFLNEGGVDYD